jgi:hypothetical protein
MDQDVERMPRNINSQKVVYADDFVKSPSSRLANLVSRGVLAVRRSDREMKRNAEIGFFTRSSRKEQHNGQIPTVVPVVL